jgi:hypothetical protein
MFEDMPATVQVATALRAAYFVNPSDALWSARMDAISAMTRAEDGYYVSMRWLLSDLAAFAYWAAL